MRLQARQPKAIEALRIHLGVARGIGQLPVAEIGGKRARVDAWKD
jgi:hypothetical protein